ncbi:hypothetical protein R70006_06257 [Paraburkholderia domus]|uniref:prepilin peptidase n=1 Tax=Paraburkholderia domus TaxID=2793075 RepID=UPI001912A6C9|nr:A24 family peptidase [Paraburkholderia domus]MBK5052889.1 prepilin peptidase [Burkholderia sp. R-70006]CAE6822239.1 hypothetical protein R70006_06257 [Paraburkholderia domus]
MSDFSIEMPLLVLAGLGIGTTLNGLAARLPLWLARAWGVPPEAVFVSAGSATSSRRWRELVVLSLLALVTNWLIFRLGLTPRAVAAISFCAVLIVLALVDLDTRMLPDIVTIPLLLLGLCCNLQEVFTTMESAMIGAVAGWLALMVAHWVSLSLGRGEGMGQGDAKMLAAIGAWVGWQMMCDALLSACIAACVVAAALRVARPSSRGETVPFGAFLAMGGIAVILFWPFELADMSGWRSLL